MDMVLTNLIITIFGSAIGSVTPTVIDGLAELWHDSKEKIPEERRIEPTRSFAGPVLEKAKYHTQDPILRELFCELLSKGFDESTQNQAHPAFAGILEHLSADEAYLLWQFKKFSESESVRGFGLFFKRFTRGEQSLPWEAHDLETNLELDKIRFPENVEMYIHHLTQLGLLMEDMSHARGEVEVISSPLTGQANMIHKEGKEKVVNFVVSAFGELFLKAVIPENMPYL